MVERDEIQHALNCALRQFRHNDDNSPNYFKPAQGFVNAYDTAKIDVLVARLQARISETLERERALVDKASKCVPTNWLDPLLTGPDAVVPKGVDGRWVEALLRGIQDRIRALAAHQSREGGESDDG